MVEQTRITEYNTRLLERYVYPTLSGINIVRGCGERPCRICSENSPSYQTSMKMGVLMSIFSTFQRDIPLMLFGQGDPIYYRDENYSIKDVFALAHQYRVRINVRTHGCLCSERNTILAVKTLVEYLIVNGIGRTEARLDFSVDGYGWVGISPEEHLSSVTAFYALISALDPCVFAFVNENANRGELGSYQHLSQLLEAAQIPRDVVMKQEILFFMEGDRPSKLSPKPPMNERYTPWTGTFIDADGTILYNHPILGIIRCGNMYGSIRTNSLPQPDGSEICHRGTVL